MIKGFMIVLLLVTSIVFAYQLSGHMEQVANNYSSDDITRIIDNMEAPAAGGEKSN